MDRNNYLAFRRRFVPSTVRLVIVAESPPASGKYFYNSAGAVTEPLFRALTRQLGIDPLSKEIGLLEFQRRGWLLVDATYEPVDKLGGAARNAVIVRDYPLLVADLTELANRATPIVLIKTNICDLLEQRLSNDGFRVINRGTVIYFPAYGRQGQFAQQFDAVLKMAKL